VSLAFGTILISIGIDLPIQLYNRLREELCQHELATALQRTVERFAGPAILATLGPAAVFAACTISKFRGLRELGALSALGLLVNCVAMLTVFPALLAALPRARWIAKARPVSPRGPLRALGEFSSRAPRVMLVIAAIALVASVPGALAVRFDRSLFAQPPLMPPSRVQEELARRFGQKDGAAIAYVEEHDPGASADELDERALQKSDRWLVEAERLEKAGLLRGHQSLSSLVSSVATQTARHQHLGALDPAARARAIRAQLEALGFEPSALDGFLSQLTAPFAPLHVRDLPDELGFLVRLHLHREAGTTTSASFLYPVDGARESEALTAIGEAAKGAAGGVITGKPLVEPALREAAQRDLLRATLLAALLVGLLVALHYRRWRPTLAILAPLLLAWVGFGATLYLFKVPLNLYNLLAVPLVIGYGIDDHVFLLSRFEEQGHRDVAEALASTGRAVIVTSLATIAGFLPIAFARFPPLRLLGISAALAVGWCLVAAFVALPAMLTILWKEDRS
jgi:predicted RND superfamily exporter protein